MDLLRFVHIFKDSSLLLLYLHLDDVVGDGGPAVALRGVPGQVAVLRPPVQDVWAARLCRLVCKYNTWITKFIYQFTFETGRKIW